MIIFLSFALKGKGFHKDEIKWNDYFLSYLKVLLSSIVAYILLGMFEFQYPLSFTIILTITCVILTLCKYIIKKSNEIVEAIRKIHQSAMTEENNN